MKKRILFIGDSITDCGREYNDSKDLGNGYPLLVAKRLSTQFPTIEFDVLNKGINGNKIADLRARFDTDCLALEPDIVSILIGINDTWHNVNDPTTFATEQSMAMFEKDYRYLIEKLLEKGIKQVVLMEPFVLPEPLDRQTWRKDLDPKIQIIRRLAEEYHLVFVPLDGKLNALGITRGFSKYTGEDGVHPTLAGHEIIAQSWLEFVVPEMLVNL
ncbi:SGNH/GDSL hydrolase family protein [Enterococcus durans]|uniref:SGNH/GDSL hydrolase family protein n=1 Tax=Enterococcus durans TaxID=53345 RepID=UPI000BA8C314|nr:SGNH/GDSL hydrolase family protein [Enterococcus durans]ASV94185.1 GDSL family lipase [Enterococcus durans]MBX9041776.1 SGNH/GDSL hydrolase family protein [Enterococcus durans]MBX9077613.1 SGNH/GDSL hydrolase family protein [Enterococcus durans]MCB8505538.1 SGNH/GDSL hydrolase family protein [Enterococcus durans]MCB8515732.1 SGNH/GDSL hydrolase family protein [Enterococcus durans]